MAKSVHQLARELDAAFMVKTRDSGETFYCLADGRPEWMQDVCRDAHDDTLPDDWRYRMIRHAVEMLADDPETEDCDAADAFVTVMNHELLDWLSSHGNRLEYVNEAVSNMGGTVTDIMQAVMAGQYDEAREVFNLVREALDALADDDCDEEADAT